MAATVGADSSKYSFQDDELTRQMRSRMVQSMLNQGMESGPVGHWTQALARALQGAVGGWGARQERLAGQERERQISDIWKSAPGLDGGTAPSGQPAVSGPSGTPATTALIEPPKTEGSYAFKTPWWAGPQGGGAQPRPMPQQGPMAGPEGAATGPTPQPQPQARPRPQAGFRALPGASGAAINQAASLTGVDPRVLTTFARIESGGNPATRTGSYKGLFQLSNDEFAKAGGKGDIFDPNSNAQAAAIKLQREHQQFSKILGREATPSELYMVHQQGIGGATNHMRFPDRPAWLNMAATGEGKHKGAGWAKQAIWGNIPNDMKRQFGRVENVTSKAFTDMWNQKFQRLGGGDRLMAGAGGNAQAAAMTAEVPPEMRQALANLPPDQALQNMPYDGSANGMQLDDLVQRPQSTQGLEQSNLPMNSGMAMPEMATLLSGGAGPDVYQLTPMQGGGQRVSQNIEDMRNVPQPVSPVAGVSSLESGMASQPGFNPQVAQARTGTMTDAGPSAGGPPMGGAGPGNAPGPQRQAIPPEMAQYIKRLLSNPGTRAAGQQLWMQEMQRAAQGNQFTFHHTPEGQVLRQNPKTGSVEVVTVPGLQGKQEKVPDSLKTDAGKAQAAYSSVTKALDDYNKTVGQTGATYFQGIDKDRVQRQRTNILLQLKELYNLGVLNGPDLMLMESMLPSPDVQGYDPRTWGNALNPSDRVDAAVADMKVKLREMLQGKLEAAQPGAQGMPKGNGGWGIQRVQ